MDRYINSIHEAYPDVNIEKYVIMPNHVHILFTISNDQHGAPGSSRPTQMVPRIIAAIKRFSNRDAGKQLWQDSYHDHIIRDDNDFLNHWRYIDDNPVKWAEDKYYSV